MHLVPVPTGHQARTLGEFRDALAEVDASSLFFHIIDARYRHGLGRSDFAEWVDVQLGLPELGERLAHVDPGVGNLERIRDRTERNTGASSRMSEAVSALIQQAEALKAEVSRFKFEEKAEAAGAAGAGPRTASI